MPLKYIFAGLSLLFYFLYVPFRFKRITLVLNRKYLQCLIYLFPFLDLNITNDHYGSISVFDLMTLVTVCIGYRSFFKIKRSFSFFYFLFFLLFTGLILGALHSYFPLNAMYNIISFLSPFFFCKILFSEISTNYNYYIQFFKKFKVIFIVDVLFVLMQMLFGPTLGINEANPNVVGADGTIRYTGIFSDAQTHGCFLGMFTFLNLLDPTNGFKINISNTIKFFLSIVLIFLAGSRGPLLGLIGGFLTIFWILPSNVKIIFVLVGGLIGILLVFFSNSIPIFKRSEKVSADVKFRERLWNGGRRIYKDNKDFGIGLGNYQLYATNRAQDQYIIIGALNKKDFSSAPESGYIESLVEFGTWNGLLIALFILIPILSVFYSSGLNKWIIDRSQCFYYLAAIVVWSLSYISLCNTVDERILVLLCFNLTYLLADYSIRFHTSDYGRIYCN